MGCKLMLWLQNNDKQPAVLEENAKPIVYFTWDPWHFAPQIASQLENVCHD